jgi:hypothetical protein
VKVARSVLNGRLLKRFLGRPLTNNRGKYRFLVEIDLIEGFTGEHRIKLTPSASLEALKIMKNAFSKKANDGSQCTFYSYGYAYYSFLEDAVNVANQLAAFTPTSYQIVSDRWEAPPAVHILDL